MKKLSFLMFALVATMMLSAQTFKVTWNLDGGATNQYGATNKSELFNAFMKDAGVATFETLEYYMQQADPLGSPNMCSALTNAAPALTMEKWAWLKAYIEKAHADQAAAGASALAADGTGAAWRYAVGAFFITGQRASWPKSADFTELGKETAYVPVMNAAGQYYAYPAEVAADFVLPTPYKTGYTFAGWYNGETKVEAIAADVELTAKWEVVKYNVTWNLDGGKLVSTNKSELFNEFMKDAGAASFETLEYYMQQADPLSSPNICAALTNAAPALTMEKWAWLKAYIEKAHLDQAAAGASALAADGTGAAWRYAVGAFFISGQRASWPKSADFTELGKETAYVPVMNAAGMFYELPAQFSIDMPLPTPVKAEYNFLGWYNGTTKVEAVDADMALAAKWERSVYIVNFVAPYAYPNNMYVDDVYELAYTLQEDYNAAYGASKAWAKMVDGQVYYNIAGEWKLPKDAQGQETTVGSFIQASTYNTTDNLKKLVETEGSKWAWVKDAVVAQRTAAGLSTDITEALYRKEISAMFLASPANTSWPASSAWTTYNADAIAKAWGGIVALPDTIAEDYTLPAMYRKNYEFKGWYWNADFSGDAVTVVPVKSNGTLYAKFEATEFALLGIELSKKDTVELQMPATDTLSVIFKPETAVNKNVTWSSSNEEVLVVENGVITPKAPGVAIVKVVSEESELVATVVYNIKARVGAVTGVTLDKTTLTLPLGETATLVATVAPEDAVDKSLTWASDGKAVSVDSLGVIKADTVGTATITVTTVDGSYTATCKVTVPEPINADVKVEKLWDLAIDTKTADIGEVRNGMGYDGKFYLADKKAQTIRVFTKDGEDLEATIALNAADMVGTHNEWTYTYDTVVVDTDTTINKIDSVATPVSTTYTLGTGIAIDDAGNIVFGTNFPNAVKSIGIIKKGEKKPTIIEVTLPTTGRTDQITAFGDIFSEEGGLVALYPQNATQVQLVKIANGQLVEVKALAGTVKAGASPSQVLYATETEAWTNARGNSMQYVKDGVVTDITPKNVITNDLGGARMMIGENEVYAYKVGTVHSSEFSVRNMTAGQFAADKDGNTVHYVVDNKAAANNSYANFTKAEKINDYAYYLYVFTSGKGAGVFKVYQEVAVESIALDQTTATVKAGEKLQLTATVTPDYATVKDVVWSTSDSTIAIVDQNGLVQTVKAGEATITATTVDGGLVATCALTVKAVFYHRAMNASELKAGKKMLIVNAGDTLTMGARATSGNNFTAVGIAPVDGVLSDVPAEATIITIEKDSVFAFAVDGGYLTAGTSKSNNLRVAEERGTLTEWDITIDAAGLATIICHDVESERNTIRYNKGNNIFSAYKPGTQEDVVIYVEVDEAYLNAMEVPVVATNLVAAPQGAFDMLEASDNMFTFNLGVYADGSLHEASMISAILPTGGEADLTIVDGYLTKAYSEELATDVYSGVIYAYLGEDLYKLIVTLYAEAVEPIEIVIENAEVAVADGLLTLTATYTIEEVTYPVIVNVNGFEMAEGAKEYEAPMVSDLTIGGMGDNDPWFDAAFGDKVTVTVNGNSIVLVGQYLSYATGNIYNVTISGNIQSTDLDNVQINVETVKVMKNGQLFIIKNGVEYNAQGKMIK